MAYVFTNAQKPKFVQPAGEYILQVIGFDLGMWPDGERKIDLKLLIEGTGTSFRHTLTLSRTPQEIDEDECCNQKTADRRKQLAAFNRHIVDQFILAFELVGEGAINTEVNIDDADWLNANVVGNRAWAAVKIRFDKRDAGLPENERRKYNDVERWLIGKALPEAPASTEVESGEDNKPKF